jgi:hypothetical protein
MARGCRAAGSCSTARCGRVTGARRVSSRRSRVTGRCCVTSRCRVSSRRSRVTGRCRVARRRRMPRRRGVPSRRRVAVCCCMTGRCRMAGCRPVRLVRCMRRRRMRRRTCMLCWRRRPGSRCACLLLAPGKSWNRHHEQKHYPLLQPVFVLQNAIHYRLLTPELFSDPALAKHRSSSEVAGSL